ncbi:MAG: preprotein translocase subunit YajC [Planctomycetota bacterium]
MNNIWILAQETGEEAPSGVVSEPVTSEGEAVTVVPDSNAQPARPAQRPFGTSYWFFIIAMFILMYMILFRGPRKKQQEHKKMVQSLNKNDRVRTIGGIIGTVVDIKGDEITLKVDESTNTKIKIAPSAIGKNLSQDKS